MGFPTLKGAFIQTTSAYDSSLLESIDVNSPEFKQLLVKLYQDINNIALLLNIKDSAYYDVQEFVNGQLWYPNLLYNSSTPIPAQFRQVFRKVIITGALPNTGIITVPHFIDVSESTYFTRMYGTAWDPIGLVGIPIPNSLTYNCALSVTSTDVVIETGVDLTAFTISNVVLEYIQT